MISGSIQPSALRWLSNITTFLVFFRNISRCRMFKRLQLGFPLAIDPGDELNPLFGIAKLAVAMFEEGHTSFVTAQTLFQGGRTVFEAAKNSFEFGQSLLKRNRF